MKKLTYTHIKTLIEQEGHILVSQEYTNAREKLLLKCPEGHEYSLRWYLWKTGYRCPYCSKRPPIGIDRVRESINKEGYTLLSDVYTNAKTKFLFICPKGHTYKISWEMWKMGSRCGVCAGKNKGGMRKLNLPPYDTYADRLRPYHEVYELEGPTGYSIVGVNCEYCGKLTVPSVDEVYRRLMCLGGVRAGDQRFYCSDECKNACSIYRQHAYPKGFSLATSREVQPQLRKLVLERDNWSCKKCNRHHLELHCHHIDPVINNPVESADTDNCITLCKACHEYIHSLPGCKYHELKC